MFVYRSVWENETSLCQWRVVVGTAGSARNVWNAEGSLNDGRWRGKLPNGTWNGHGRTPTSADAPNASGAAHPRPAGSQTSAATAAATATAAASSRGNAWRGHVSGCRGHDATSSTTSTSAPRGDASRIPPESYDPTKHAPRTYAHVTPSDTFKMKSLLSLLPCTWLQDSLSLCIILLCCVAMSGILFQGHVTMLLPK